MDDSVRRLVGWGALVAPAAHTLTDVLEWVQSGFSSPQLWLNYVAFVPLPAVMIGLYAVQAPRIARLGLLGALVYGIAFVYFAHTTLLALESNVPTYERLWEQLGGTYTLHGALMILGGLAFGVASARAGVLPAWTSRLLMLGIALNLVVALVPVPDLLQTIGSAVRNAGLVGMGWAVARGRSVTERLTT